MAVADKSQPTEAEQRWINALYQFVETGEPGDGMIHEQRMVRTALRPFQLNPEQLQVFDNMAVGAQILRGMWENMSDDTWVTFLRMRDLEDGRVALFRNHGDDGLNYIEWYLEQNPDGEVWAWDANVYSSGERMTETLRRLWLPAVAQLDEQVRQHMGKRNRELAAHIMRLNDMRLAANSGDHEKAIEIYESFPQSVQEERALIVLIMHSYFELGKEDQYLRLLEQFLELHGEASNRELMLMDVYIFREQYDKSLEMIDDLDKRLGGDIFLETYRASIAYLQNDYEKTRQFLDRGIQREPALLDFYWESIDYALAEQDWPRVSKMLDAVQEQGIELIPLGEVDVYDAYLATDEYQRWLNRQSQAVQDEQRGVVGQAEADENE